ncbi:ESPR-type extended signal peptide-containing protein, partial [Gallibacterium anatis]|uniref:ESPR-type extended signal peptide-containing protein n=1 Tax=Gallibacterium anatis TaxID=750 RepID=UPI0030042A07
MNKIYKVIFNRNKNRYEIVSELASSRGGKCKVKAGKQIAKLFMTGLLATFLSSVALAADEDVKVKYDAATGTIKIVKTNDESQVLASYAVGGNISSIDPNTGTNPTGNISLGQGSKVLQKNTIAIGTDAHAGDANGSVTQSDGKIAIGNKTVASGDRSIALGNQSTTNKGSYNIAQGNDSIAIGTSTSVFGYSGVSIGRRNIIGVPDPDLVKGGVLTTKSKTKYGENDEGGNSVIVGVYNVAYGNRSNVIGTYSRAMGSNSVAIGSGVQSLSDGSIAIGKGSGYEFQEGSRKGGRREKEFYGRDWELPPEYKVLKQVLSTDIAGDKQYEKETGTWENGGTLPKYNNYGAGSSDPGGFIVEGKNALGIGTYTQVRGDSAIGLATGEMTADLSKKDKSQYARDMRKIMDMEETLYDAKEALKSGSTSDKATLEANVKTAEESLAAAKKEFRKNYLSKYSFVEGEGALGVGRQILAQGDRSMAVGDYAKAISNDAIAYGGQTLANGTNSMAMGGSAHVGTIDISFDNSMAIGSHTNVQAGNAVALGAFSQVTGQNSLALGFGKQDGNNINYNAVSGKDSTLIGSYGNITGNNSILIGSSGSIANDRVVALGNNIHIAKADENDQVNNTSGSVFLGDHAGYVTDSKRARSLGKVDVVGSNEKMELTESLSSTKGALRDYTKDFIYIYMLERQDDGTQIGAPIAVRSDFAGGDSTVGVVSVGSTYEQTFENLDKIKEHHKKVGSLITVPVEVTVQVTKNGISLGEQQQIRYFAADAKEEDIKNDSTLSDEDKKKVWDTIQESRKKADTKYTVFETRRIQNVAPGLIGVNSTDAINGSQLFATNQMLGNLVGSLKKTFGDNVTITEDGQIKVSGGTLGWIAKAKAADGGTVDYQVGKDDKITKDNLKEKGSAIEAADQLVFQAGKNIGLVQTPDTLTISTIDTPSFKSVELRGDEKTVDGKKVTEVTKIDSNGMKVVTETSTLASDGGTTPTVTEKVSTTVGKDGVSTDGSVKVTNGTTDLVTIDKGTDNTGTDQEYGKIGLDGKNGSNATITVDRGTSSLDDTKNIGGTDPKQDISENNPAKMDRITYTTKNKDDKDVITHEVATMDDGLFFSGDSADGKDGNVKNKFDRKLSQETKIIGGVDLGLTDSASAKERQEAIAAKLTDGNIGVISDGTDTLTVKLAKQLTGLDSATYTSPTTKTDDGDDATSTMKVDGNGIRFVGDNNAVKTDAPSLTTDGIDGGNKQITNIDSGLKNGNTTISISDLKDPNKTATINPILNNAVNVSDLKTIVDAGFKLNTSGQPTDPGATTVKIGDTINVVDGANTKVSAITPENGTHTFHIDVNGLPMSYVDNQGKPLTKIGDTFYRTEELVDGKPPAGAKGVPDTEVTSNVTMLDKNGKNVEAPQIKNIGSGLVNGNNKAMSPSDLLNTADNNPVLKNAVNAGDLKQVAAAVKTEVTGTGKAIVTNTTAQDGHTIYNVHVDPVVNVVAADGKTQVVRGDDGKYYDPADIENKTFVPDGKGGGNWYNTSDIGDNGQPNTGASVQNINPVDVKNNFVNPNGTGSIVVDNVKSGIGGEVKDPAHNNKNTFIDNVNKVGKTTPDGTATQDAISENTVVNAKDLKNLVDTGFKLNTSGQPADPGATTVKIGETIKVVDGTNTKVSAITTSKDGVHAFHIDVTGMPISYTDTDGNALTKIGDNYYKNTDITNGVPNKDAVAVDPEKVTDNIKVINKDGSTTNPGTISNVKSAIDGVVGNGAPNGSTINGEGGTNTFIDNINKVGKPANEGGIDKTTVVNAGDLKNLADTPLFFSGDSADGVVAADGTDKNTFSRKLSQETKIVGGVDLGLQADATAEQRKAAIADKLTDNNIGVVSNGTDTLTIKLAKNLVNLTSVETGSGNNKTKMTENGVTTTVKDGDTFKVTTTTPNGLATTEVKLDSNNMPTGESKTTTVTTDGVTITTQTPPDPDRNKPASTTETKLSKDGLATDGTIKVTGDAKDLVTIGKGTETDPKATDKEFGTVAIDGKNGSNAILTVDRGTKSVTDKANILKDPKQPAGDNNPVSMDRLTYTTTGADGKSIINHEVATLDDGFFLTTSTDVAKGKAAAGVKLNHTIKFTDGANTKVSTVDSKDGIHELHVDVTGLPMTYTVSQTGGTDAPVSVSKVGDTYQLADGTKLVKVGDKFYKPSQLVNPKAG